MKKQSIKLLIRWLMRNEMESVTLRRLFRQLYQIDVGLHSYGCFDPSRIPAGTTIGRYCSFAKTVHFFPRNHGIDFLSTHPYLYNSRLGLIAEDAIPNVRFMVEDDVWLGHNATITSSARHIGRGAVIAANAVVTKDVPAYAVVGGNPAKVLRYRFPDEIIAKIEATQWWLMSKDAVAQELARNPNYLYRPAEYFDARN